MTMTDPRGVAIAQQAIRAIAADDEETAVRLLEGTTQAEASAAAMYLLSALREATQVYAKHHNRRRKRGDRYVTPRGLLLGATDDAEDVLMASVDAVLAEAEERGGCDG